MVTHPSTNWARHTVTSLIKTNALPLSQAVATTEVLSTSILRHGLDMFMWCDGVEEDVISLSFQDRFVTSREQKLIGWLFNTVLPGNGCYLRVCLIFILTESDYVRSLHSLLKERVANGLTPYGMIFGFCSVCKSSVFVAPINVQ